MSRRPTHAEAERRFRALIARAALPAPDEALHARDAVVFLWNESRLLVLVDLDEVDDSLEDFDPRLLFVAEADGWPQAA